MTRWGNGSSVRPRPLPGGLRIVQVLLVLLVVAFVLILLTAWIQSDGPTRWIVEQ